MSLKPNNARFGRISQPSPPAPMTRTLHLSRRKSFALVILFNHERMIQAWRDHVPRLRERMPHQSSGQVDLGPGPHGSIFPPSWVARSLLQPTFLNQGIGVCQNSVCGADRLPEITCYQDACLLPASAPPSILAKPFPVVSHYFDLFGTEL